MKFWKFWLLALFCCAIAGFCVFTAMRGQDDAPQTSAAEEAVAVETGGSAKAESGVEEKAAFLAQIEAVCALHQDNWLLLQLNQDETRESAEEALPGELAFANEIIETVRALVRSETFAKLNDDEENEQPGVIEGKVEKGETISTILEKNSKGDVQPYISAAKKIFSLQSFKEGQPYIVHVEPETGRVRRFEYEINGKSRLVVEGEDKPEARLEDIEYVTRLDIAEGVIDDNLFKAIADIGENPKLAMSLVKLFGSEINFIRHLQSGDSFSVLMEKRYRDGEYRGYGRILAAVFTNKGKTYEAFLFRDGKGNETYYNDKGENLHKTLLQAPLSLTRMTSRFSHNRFHPILGFSRPHLGVDYGAPTGTPVKAVGDGVVTERGWAGGYGNQIVVKHGGGLESLYSHLSGFAKGVREGEKVRQGQVIGFVGSTGLSTGPHLDFRLRQNGKFIDPVKVINPRGAPVAEVNMKAFKQTRDLARACLKGEKVIENYAVDSIVPLTVVSVEEEYIQSPEEVEAEARYMRAQRRRIMRNRQALLKLQRSIMSGPERRSLLRSPTLPSINKLENRERIKRIKQLRRTSAASREGKSAKKRRRQK